MSLTDASSQNYILVPGLIWIEFDVVAWTCFKFRAGGALQQFLTNVHGIFDLDDRLPVLTKVRLVMQTLEVQRRKWNILNDELETATRAFPLYKQLKLRQLYLPTSDSLVSLRAGQRPFRHQLTSTVEQKNPTISAVAINSWTALLQSMNCTQGLSTIPTIGTYTGASLPGTSTSPVEAKLEATHIRQFA